MKLNVWQVYAIRTVMQTHDDHYDDQDLAHAYAEVEVLSVGDNQNERIIVITWEDGSRKVLGDNYDNHFSDHTHMYPESRAEQIRRLAESIT